MILVFCQKKIKNEKKSQNKLNNNKNVLDARGASLPALFTCKVINKTYSDTKHLTLTHAGAESDLNATANGA